MMCLDYGYGNNEYAERVCIPQNEHRVTDRVAMAILSECLNFVLCFAGVSLILYRLKFLLSFLKYF